MATSATPAQKKIRGGNFLIEETNPQDVFTPEDFSDQHKLIEQTAEDFAVQEIVPNADRIEQKDFAFSRELLKKAAELGLTSVDIPEEYGGAEMDKVSSSIIADRIAKSGSFAVTFSAHVGIGTLPIVWFGTEAQKKKYLPLLAGGDWVGAYALSESSSGSDAMNARTKAVLSADGKHYLLNGEKMWITNSSFADVFVIFAKVDGEKFTAFIVERTFPGFSVGPEEHKLGIRGSSTCPLILNDCQVPIENVLGEIGKGATIAFNILNVGRFKLGAACVGGARTALANSIKWAKERKAFGKSISEFGMVREMLADIAIGVYAGRGFGISHRRDDGCCDLPISRRVRPMSPSSFAKQSRSTRLSAPSSRCGHRRCSTWWWTTKCRSSVDTALSRSTRPSAPIGTQGSIASLKAQTKSIASSLPDGF